MENDLAMMEILLYNVSSVKAMNFPTLLTGDCTYGKGCVNFNIHNC